MVDPGAVLQIGEVDVDRVDRLPNTGSEIASARSASMMARPTHSNLIYMAIKDGVRAVQAIADRRAST